MQRRRFLAAAATATPFLAGCTGGDGGGDGGDGDGGGEPTTTATPTPTPEPTEAEPADAEVQIELFRFGPQKTKIEPGQTVRWVNTQVASEHTVKSAQFTDDATAWDFESEPFATDESVTYTFEEKGIYTYFCGLHGEEQNCAVVLVGGTSYEAENLPCNEGSVQ